MSHGANRRTQVLLDPDIQRHLHVNESSRIQHFPFTTVPDPCGSLFAHSGGVPVLLCDGSRPYQEESRVTGTDTDFGCRWSSSRPFHQDTRQVNCTVHEIHRLPLHDRGGELIGRAERPHRTPCPLLLREYCCISCGAMLPVGGYPCPQQMRSNTYIQKLVILITCLIVPLLRWQHPVHTPRSAEGIDSQARPIVNHTATSSSSYCLSFFSIQDNGSRNTPSTAPPPSLFFVPCSLLLIHSYSRRLDTAKESYLLEQVSDVDRKSMWWSGTTTLSGVLLERSSADGP